MPSYDALNLLQFVYGCNKRLFRCKFHELICTVWFFISSASFPLAMTFVMFALCSSLETHESPDSVSPNKVLIVEWENEGL